MIGVSLGDNCLVYRSMEWPSEPYLVTIGNNVQLTKGVAIHTHGGGNVVRRKVPDFDVFGKVVIKDWAYIGAHAQIMPGVTIGEGAMVAAGSVVEAALRSDDAFQNPELPWLGIMGYNAHLVNPVYGEVDPKKEDKEDPPFEGYEPYFQAGDAVSQSYRS